MSEIARRIRAARAYAGLSRVELGAHLDTSHETIRRMEDGRRDPRRPELWAIAEVTGLPRAFFVIDFAELAASLDRDLEEGEADADDFLQQHGPNGRPSEEDDDEQEATGTEPGV